MMVELKRVKTELGRKHLKQVTSYAIDAGCEWVLLTNGREWKVYHVEFGKPPDQKILDTWNLMEDDIDLLVNKFDLISYKSVKKEGLETHWERVKALAPDSLLNAIVNNDTFNVIRRNLRRDTGIQMEREELYKGICKLLNEAAAKSMSNIKIPKSKPRKKNVEKKANPVVEESRTEDEPLF